MNDEYAKRRINQSHVYDDLIKMEAEKQRKFAGIYDSPIPETAIAGQSK